MHHRMEPKPHRFHYNVFLFCIDIDCMKEDFKKLFLAGVNRPGIFSFYDKDHFEFPGTKKTLREQLNTYLEQNGIPEPPARILLLTNLRLFGYVFNPVSFYFCFDANNNPLCAIAEVSNTFREMKMYFLGKECLGSKGTGKDSFHLRTKKYFYVSPFIAHDAEFDFSLEVPGEKLSVRIDDYKGDNRFFISTLTGRRKALTNARLLGYLFRFPFITLRIITLIHWNALLLWGKKIRFYRKGEQKDLQRNVLRPYKD